MYLQYRLVSTGKWHAPDPKDSGKTACGSRAPMTTERKDLDLIDSSDRCRDPKCVTARNQAAGRV